MGVLVDSNNWVPSPPKKKWMMDYYLEEFPTNEEKNSSSSSSICYTNGGVISSTLSSSPSPPSLINHPINTINIISPHPSHPSSHHHITTSSSSHPVSNNIIQSHHPFSNIIQSNALINNSQTNIHLLTNQQQHLSSQILANNKSQQHHHLAINNQSHQSITYSNGIHHEQLITEEISIPIQQNGGIGSMGAGGGIPHSVSPYMDSQSPVSSSGISSPSSLSQRHYALHIDESSNGGGSVINSIGDVHGYMGSSSHSMDGSKRRTGISGIREVHNKLEKNRRAHLKECFEILKRQVPPAQEEKKSSNLSILHSAIRYIQFLRRREREFEHEMERLAREKIASQQKLSLLKKELSARWEHIDFNTLLPENMELDIPYESYNHEVYQKERHFIDEEGRIISSNGVGSDGGDHGDASFNGGGGGGGSSASNSLKCGETSLYSSNSSLSSTMSPLQTAASTVALPPQPLSNSYIPSTTTQQLHVTKSHHVQVYSANSATAVTIPSNNNSSSLPIHFVTSNNVNMRMLSTPSSSGVVLPIPVSMSEQQPVALTVHSNGTRSRKDSSPRSTSRSPSSCTVSPLSSVTASPPSSTVIVSDASLIKFNHHLSPRSYGQVQHQGGGGHPPNGVMNHNNILSNVVFKQGTSPNNVFANKQGTPNHVFTTKQGTPNNVFTTKQGTTPNVVFTNKQISPTNLSTSSLMKAENINVVGPTKIVPLNNLPPGLVPNSQVLFASTQLGTKVVSHPSQQQQLIKPLPSLQPISSNNGHPSPPHQIILKQGSSGTVTSMVVMSSQGQLTHQKNGTKHNQK